MAATPPPIPRTIEEVFNDFKGRRAGIVRALTVDVEEFYQQCDPEKLNLCLYGLPNETWEAKEPVEVVPPELPDPSLGINFARDGMLKKDWLSLIAVHSDSWLLSVAFFHGARFGIGKSDRMRLFEMINDYPTVYEEFIEQLKKQAATHNNDKSEEEDEEEEDEEEEETSFCGACGDGDEDEDFWICCDVCDGWFHGQCVNITPAEAKHIKQYKCPTCSKKKFRPQRAKKLNRK